MKIFNAFKSAILLETQTMNILAWTIQGYSVLELLGAISRVSKTDLLQMVANTKAFVDNRRIVALKSEQMEKNYLIPLQKIKLRDPQKDKSRKRAPQANSLFITTGTDWAIRFA